MKQQTNKNNERFNSFLKINGFCYSSSEFSGTEKSWEFGPNGTELKKESKNYFEFFVTNEEKIVSFETPIILHEKVLEKSQHLESFSSLLLSTNFGKKYYLRPETCQGIFCNYHQIKRTTRFSHPFGLAQIGKSFRNEKTLNHDVFRTREFEQMELEFFCSETDSWWQYWNKKTY